MTKLDAYKHFLGTSPIHADDIATVFQFGNENIYEYTVEKMSFAYEMAGHVLANFGLPASHHFSPDMLCEETVCNVRFNSKGGFFCTIINPIKGTDRTALSIVIGNMDMNGTTVQIDGEDKEFNGSFETHFILGGEVTNDDYFFPSGMLALTEKDGVKRHIIKSTPEEFKNFICYADEAFTAVISDDVPIVGSCQYWLDPDSTTEEQYDYITQRSAEDLAQEIVEIEAEMDLQHTPIPMPPTYQ